MEQEKVSIYIDGEIVDQPKLIVAYRFWKKYHLLGKELECPLCGCDLYENEKFICQNCGEIMSKEEQCHEHDLDLCRDCCEHCQDQKAYEDAVNSKIDQMRGK